MQITHTRQGSSAWIDVCYKLLEFCHQRGTVPRKFDKQTSRNTGFDTMCYDRSRSEIATIAGCACPEGTLTESSVPARIAAFLDGTTCGEDLLHALYDYVLEEPIPEAIRATLNK